MFSFFFVRSFFLDFDKQICFLAGSRQQMSQYLSWHTCILDSQNRLTISTIKYFNFCCFFFYMIFKRYASRSIRFDSRRLALKVLEFSIFRSILHFLITFRHDISLELCMNCLFYHHSATFIRFVPHHVRQSLYLVLSFLSWKSMCWQPTRHPDYLWICKHFSIGNNFNYIFRKKYIKTRVAKNSILWKENKTKNLYRLGMHRHTHTPNLW